MIKYKAMRPYLGDAEIRAVEVLRETEASVWTKNGREAKLTPRHHWFDTWDEAHRHLIEFAEKSVQIRKSQLAEGESALRHIKSMSEPDK